MRFSVLFLLNTTWRHITERSPRWFQMHFITWAGSWLLAVDVDCLQCWLELQHTLSMHPKLGTKMFLHSTTSGMWLLWPPWNLAYDLLLSRRRPQPLWWVSSKFEVCMHITNSELKVKIFW